VLLFQTGCGHAPPAPPQTVQPSNAFTHGFKLPTMLRTIRYKKALASMKKTRNSSAVPNERKTSRTVPRLEGVGQRWQSLARPANRLPPDSSMSLFSGLATCQLLCLRNRAAHSRIVNVVFDTPAPGIEARVKGSFCYSSCKIAMSAGKFALSARCKSVTL
jgi:hypothetical protein